MPVRPSRHTVILFVLFVTLHAPLFLYDIFHPDAALNADRARIRLEKISFLFDNANLDVLPELRDHPIYNNSLPALGKSDAPSRLAALGLPGDYLLHGILIVLFGIHGLILVQLALAFASIFALHLISKQIGLSDRYALWIAIAYMILPTTLAHPHQLVTEAIVNPSLIILTYNFMVHLTTNATRSFGIAVLLAGLLPMLRPQFVALPMLLSGILLWRRRDVLRSAVVFCAPLIVMAAWMTFVWSQSGTFGGGRSEFGLAHNLFLQADRIATIYRLDFDPQRSRIKEMSIEEYISFVLTHPREWVQFRLTENVNMFLNTGVNQLLGNYLKLESFAPRGSGGGPMWHELRGRLTFFELVERMFQQDRLWLVTFVVGSILWGSVLVLSMVGAYVLIRERRCDRGIKAVLVGMACYGLLSAQPALLRPAHRSAVDFLIVMGAGIAIRRFGQEKKSGGREEEGIRSFR